MHYLSIFIQVLLITTITISDIALHRPFDWVLGILLLVATIDKAADDIAKEIKKLNNKHP